MKNRINKTLKNMLNTLRYFGWSSILIFGIVIIINLALYSSIVLQRDALVYKEISSASQDLETINFHINHLLAGFHNDVDIIRDSNEAADYLNNPNANTLNEFEAMLLRLSSNKSEFINVSLIDLQGNELLRVYRDGEDILVEDNLIQVDLNNYLSGLSTVPHHSILILPFVENNGNPLFYFFTPLLFEDEINSYILVAYDANEFLSIFEVFVNDEDRFYEIGLVNNDNVWLIDLNNQSFGLLNDPEVKSSVLQNIDSDKNTIRYDINLSDDFYTNSDLSSTFFRLYATIDFEATISSSRSSAVQYPWIISFLDVFLLSAIFIVGNIMRKKSEDRILLNANMYLSDRNNDGVIITDNKFKTHYVNKAFEDFYGYTLTDMNQKNPREVIGASEVSFTFNDSYLDEDFMDNVWNQTKDGIKLLKYLRIRKELDTQGKVKHYIGIYSDPFIHFPDFDINFLSEISKLILPIFSTKKVILGKSVIKILHVDNVETYTYALFLKKNLGHHAMVAIPYKSYILLYSELNDNELLSDRMDNIDKLIEIFRHQRNVSPYFSQSYSLAVADEERNTFGKLIEAAFIGLEVAKNDPQTKHHVFKSEMIDIIHREKEVRDALRSGFNQDEFFINYQLQKDVESDRIIGVEALIRWESKSLGIIYPDEFLPLIESGFYINDLSPMVIRKVIEDFTPYFDLLPNDFRISVNLTSFDFANSYILKQIVNQIEMSQLPTDIFTFEITESNYIDNVDETNSVINNLHKKGIKVAIDDFGTGYSSINSLKSIDVDYVKIDKIFLKKYPETDDGKMFKIIADLIHKLKKPIIVEGIESEEHVDFVKENHCKYGQGYYYSRPTLLEKIIDSILNK